MRTLMPLILVVFVLALANAARAQATKNPSAPFRFTDVTAEAGLADSFRGAFNHAIAWGDFDNDGRLDFFFGTFADRSPRYGMKRAPANMLFRQRVGGQFERVAAPTVAVPMRCSGAVFVDLDNDGQLDLYVTSNRIVATGKDAWRQAAKDQGCKLYRNVGGQFVDVSGNSGVCPASLLRCRDAGVLDYDGDGLLDLLVMQDRGTDPGEKLPGVRLFRNLGSFKFKEVTNQVGIPADIWGVGLASADLNGDQRPDFYLCGCNRLFLSQPDHTYREARTLRPVFNQPEKELDWVTGASFGDLNGDGQLDLITGRHHYHGPSRVHVYLNGGLRDGVPQFREITRELGISALPQKAPHPEIQDFDNDGIPDLYWSAFFAEGNQRWPFICRGLGVKDGLPRFAVPSLAQVKPLLTPEGKIRNEVPPEGLGMVYQVASPVVDYNGDGRLDLSCGIWPDEPSRLFRNDTSAGNWLQVRVQGKKMNRMGVGTQVRVHSAGKVGEKTALLGLQEITLNGGYCSGRPGIAHFGLGKREICDLHITFPSQAEPLVIRRVAANQQLLVREP